MDGAKNEREWHVNAHPRAKEFLRHEKWAEFESRDVVLSRKKCEATLTGLDLDDLGTRILNNFHRLRTGKGNMNVQESFISTL